MSVDLCVRLASTVLCHLCGEESIIHCVECVLYQSIIDWHLRLLAVKKHQLDRLGISDCQGIVRATYCDVYRYACTSELDLKSLSILS